jgi:putative phosphoesterase
MRFRRLREAANADLIVCGHTHRPFVRTVDGVLFVNPGSVGVAPTHLGTACYALIDTEEAPWSARILEASY